MPPHPVKPIHIGEGRDNTHTAGPLGFLKIMGEPTRAAASDAAAPAADGFDDEDGFGASDVLLDSVTKDEWKTIEASLSHHKKTVAEMLKRATAQVRTKGDLVQDESNGKFLGDMLPEMDNFAVWCYKVSFIQ